ncbi:probable protein phosphatase 2C 80 isoform X1 [Coffea arabica]|uniref:Protein phosphatase n=1 Tax=Coffea arabica TaxID=13443 RepID=A0A6P6T8W7_COFAR
MSSGLLPKPNSAFYFGVQRGLRVKLAPTHKLIESLAVKRSQKFGACYTYSRTKHSAVEAFSQTRGGGGVVSRPSSQAFGKFSGAMAVSSSTAAPGDLVMDTFISGCGNVSSFAKPVVMYFGNRGLDNCQKASLSLRNGVTNSCCTDRAFSVLGGRWKCRSSNALVGSWFRSCSSSSSPCYSTGAASDVLCNGTSFDEQLSSLAIPPDQRSLSNRTLKLHSGSCYLPHPDKEKTGGEDAHFICSDEQAIGVADGVGGWAEVGINAGEYACELMSNSMDAIKNEPGEFIDPARVLEKAHSETNAVGSSTACIIVLKDQFLHAINLGDSGFIVVRDGSTTFESPVQQHGFNFPYQLERGNKGDLPSSGQVFKISVLPGDVIVAGTDGLFDNLYKREITTIVGAAVTSGFTPELTAQKVAALARHRAQDRERQTPFSTAAQEIGFSYYGGKLDDITVVVSYVSDLSGSTET